MLLLLLLLWRHRFWIKSLFSDIWLSQQLTLTLSRSIFFSTRSFSFKVKAKIFFVSLSKSVQQFFQPTQDFRKSHNRKLEVGFWQKSPKASLKLENGNSLSLSLTCSLSLPSCNVAVFFLSLYSFFLAGVRRRKEPFSSKFCVGGVLSSVSQKSRSEFVFERDKKFVFEWTKIVGFVVNVVVGCARHRRTGVVVSAAVGQPGKDFFSTRRTLSEIWIARKWRRTIPVEDFFSI